MQDQKMVEHDRHVRQRAKALLARAGHVLNSGNRCDLCNQQQERTATENSAEGRVSSRNWRTCVDLASKIWKKKKTKNEIWPKNTSTTTQENQPLPQPEQRE
jgi:hypothetical protein